MKLIHVQANELLGIMCKQLSNSSSTKYSDAIFCAIENGILKFVDKIAKESPRVLVRSNSDERFPNALWAAIFYRQAEIFSLICEVDKNKRSTWEYDKQGNNILHMTGKLPPSTLVNRTVGAAFQMQKELQWYKVLSSFYISLIHFCGIHMIFRTTQYSCTAIYNTRTIQSRVSLSLPYK